MHLFKLNASDNVSHTHKCTEAFILDLVLKRKKLNFLSSLFFFFTAY